MQLVFLSIMLEHKSNEQQHQGIGQPHHGRWYARPDLFDIPWMRRKWEKFLFSSKWRFHRVGIL